MAGEKGWRVKLYECAEQFLVFQGEKKVLGSFNMRRRELFVASEALVSAAALGRRPR